jgi:hypothetical protein
MKDLRTRRTSSAWRRLGTIGANRYRAFQAVVLLGLACVVLAGLAVKAHNPSTTETRPAGGSGAVLNTAERSFAPIPVRKTPGPPPSAAQSRPKPALTNVAHIAISPRGFDTKVIALPHAPFFLLVENRSGVGGVSFRLDRMDTGTPVNISQKDVSREELDYSDFFDLSPGTYLLSEIGHPDWQCRITVNP